MRRGGATRLHATLGWAVVAPVALLAASTAAQPGVEWRAPAECPSAALAVAEIDRLRAPGPSTQAQAQVEIRRESALHLRARVAVRAEGRESEQVLRDADCTALTRAAALVVAMAMEPSNPAARDMKPRGVTPPTAADATVEAESHVATLGTADLPQPSAATRTDTQQPAPTIASNVSPRETDIERPKSEERVVLLVPLPDRPSASPAPRVTRTLQPSAAELRDRPEPPATGNALSSPDPLRVFVGVAGGLSTGIVPQWAPSALISAGILTHQLRAALRFGYVPSQHAWLDPAAGTGGHVALTSAAAEAGLRLQLSPLEVPLFAGLEGGLFSADADGVADHTPRHETWLATFAGSGLALTWDALVCVALRAEAVVALRRPSFALASVDAAERLVFHRPSALGARVYLNLELQFL